MSPITCIPYQRIQSLGVFFAGWFGLLDATFFHLKGKEFVIQDFYCILQKGMLHCGNQYWRVHEWVCTGMCVCVCVCMFAWVCACMCLCAGEWVSHWSMTRRLDLFSRDVLHGKIKLFLIRSIAKILLVLSKKIQVLNG